MCKCVVGNEEYLEQQAIEGGLKVLQKKGVVYFYFPTLDNLLIPCEHCREYSPIVREVGNALLFNGVKFPILAYDFVSQRTERFKTKLLGHTLIFDVERDSRTSKFSRVEIVD
jgi:hypothetical protein